jgi:PAS domain S-box-containing protein
MKHNKVLIVEDEKLIATLLERRLNQFGYDVIGTTPSGEHAVEKALELKPDLILMDISLKGNIDGIDAAIEIKKHMDIPVIYLTSYSDDDTICRAKASEPAGFLVKPIDEKELLAVLDITISKHEFECKLKETEEQYKALFDLSGDYFLIVEPTGSIKETNSSCLEFLGFTKEEIKKLKFDDLLAENSMNLEILIRNISAEANKKCRFDLKLKNKDGIRFLVEMSATLLCNQDKVTSILCTAKSKKEMLAVQAEELLREKEEVLLKQNRVLNYLIKSYIPLKSDLMEVLREFTKVTTEALNTKKAGVWLFNPDHTKMECLCLFDSSQDSYISGEIVRTVKYPSFFETLDDESVIEAVNARVDMHTNDINDENINIVLNDYSISSPIHCGGEEIGVLLCEHTDDKKRWTVEEENFVTSIADLISLAFGEYERRNTIDLLESSEKKNKAIIDLIPDLMFRISSDGVFLDYKSDFAESLFAAPSQFLQKSCREVLPAELAASTEESIRKTLETGEMQTYNYFLEKDNEKKYYESRMVACGDDEVLAIIRDVTEQKRNEFALKNLNEELENIVRQRTEELLGLNKLLHEKQSHQKALLDSIPDVAWLKDSEGRYIAINKQLVQELDMLPEEIMGKIDFELYDIVSAEKYAGYDKKVLQSGIPIRYEDELRDSEGRIKWLETIKVPIFNDEGKIGGTAGTSRDITERKLTEELLEKSNVALEKLVIEGH